MADSKIDKALYGPSPLEVALGAVLGFIAGVLVASVYLTFKPVKKLASAKDIPEEPVPGMVYYVEGSQYSGRARGWQAKEQRFLAGGGIEVVEDELNAWATSFVKPASGGGEGAAAQGGKFFTGGPPNFRVVDDKLQIGFTCTIDYFGLKHDFVVHGTGRFEKSGDGVEFDTDSFYIGSCPLHKLFVLGAPVIGLLSDVHPVPEEWSNAWARVADAKIEGGLVKIEIP